MIRPAHHPDTALAFDADDTVYACDILYEQMFRAASNTLQTVLFNQIGFTPMRLALDDSGQAYVSLLNLENGNRCQVGRLDGTFQLEVIGGGDQPGLQDGFGADARFGSINGIAVDAHGTIYLSCDDNTIRKGQPASAPVITVTQPQARTVTQRRLERPHSRSSRSAVPEPAYQWWYHDGNPISGATGGGLFLHGGERARCRRLFGECHEFPGQRHERPGRADHRRRSHWFGHWRHWRGHRRRARAAAHLRFGSSSRSRCWVRRGGGATAQPAGSSSFEPPGSARQNSAVWPTGAGAFALCVAAESVSCRSAARAWRSWPPLKRTFTSSRFVSSRSSCATAAGEAPSRPMSNVSGMVWPRLRSLVRWAPVREERIHFDGERVQRQLTPLSSGEVAQFEVAEARPVQRQHLAALAGEHPAHLVVAALGQRELGFTG